MSDIVVDSRTGAGEVSVNSEVLNGIVDGGGSGSGVNSQEEVFREGLVDVVGSSDPHALTLGKLMIVGLWADAEAGEDRVLVQLTGSDRWTSKLLGELIGGSGGSGVNCGFGDYFYEKDGKLFCKLDLVGEKEVSAYGEGKGIGGGGASSVGQLTNVGEWADEVPGTDRVFVQLSGETHWSSKPLSELLSEGNLDAYLIKNKYATQAWVVDQHYLTSESMIEMGSVTGLLTALDKKFDRDSWNRYFYEKGGKLFCKFDFVGEKEVSAYGEGPSGGGGGGMDEGALTAYLETNKYVTETWIGAQGFLQTITVHNHAIADVTGLQAALNSKEAAFLKNSGFNKDFGTTVGTVVQGNDSRVENGQAAYTWGNHASAGYLKSITKAMVEGVLTGNITTHTHSQYLTSHQSLAGYAKEVWVSENFNKYVHPSGAGNNHIPAGGSAGQWLKWSASGVAAWTTPASLTIFGNTYNPNSALTLATIPSGKVTGTAFKAAVFNGSGVLAVSSVTLMELGYVSGVTSSIQTQLDSKLSVSVWNTYFEVKDGKLCCKVDFYSVGGVSAYGEGPSGGGGGGMDEGALAAYLETNKYVTETWIGAQGFLQTITVHNHAIADVTGLQVALNSKEAAFLKNSGFNKNFGTTVGTVVQGNDSRVVNGQAAYTWGNHASVGYLKSITKAMVEGVLTGNVTTHTHSQYLTSHQSLTGYLTLTAGSGKILSGMLYANDSIRLGSSGNGSKGGILFWSPSWKAWQIYMGTAGAATGANGVKAPAGSYVTTYALRSVIEGNSGYGWTWESGTSTGDPTVVAELRSSDGYFYTKGGLGSAGAGRMSSLTLTNTGVVAHVGFERGGYNYLWATKAGGSLALGVNGETLGSANTAIHINSNGYVGVGYTDVADYRLKVNGTGYFNAGVNVANNNAFRGINTTGGVVSLLYINSSNNVLVGNTGNPLYLSSSATNLFHNRAGTNYAIWDAYNFTPSNYVPIKNVLTNSCVFRDVLGYYTGAATSTGTLKITLPNSWTSTMLTFEIDIFSYNGDSSSKYIVSGYNYNSSSSGWVNTGATVIGRNVGNVRLAHDGSKCCILIGGTSSTWSYLRVIIDRVGAHYTSYNSETWRAGYSVSFLTDESGIVNVVTPSLNQPLYTKGGTVSGNLYANNLYSGNNLVATQTWVTSNFNKYVHPTGSGNNHVPSAGASGQWLKWSAAGVATWVTPATLTRGRYLTGSNYNGNAAVTWAVDGTSANTGGKVVVRDASGNFSAGVITASLTGNASSATKLLTTRTIWGQSFNGEGNVSGAISGATTGSFSGRITAGGVTLGYSNTSYVLSTSSFICNSWVRTTGTTGWFNETYSGGVYMTDTTWVRIYNSKKFYVPSTAVDSVRTDGGFVREGYAGTSWYQGQGALGIAITNNSAQTPLVVAYRAGQAANVTGANRLFSVEFLNAGTTLYFAFAGAKKFEMTSGGNFITEGSITAKGELTAYSTSDVRLKRNVRPLNGLVTLRKLKFKEFDWTGEARWLANDDRRHGYGLIAQEVRAVFPEIVSKVHGSEFLGVNYIGLIPFLGSAIMQHDDELTRLKERVRELELEVKRLKRA